MNDDKQFEPQADPTDWSASDALDQSLTGVTPDELTEKARVRFELMAASRDLLADRSDEPAAGELDALVAQAVDTTHPRAQGGPADQPARLARVPGLRRDGGSRNRILAVAAAVLVVVVGVATLAVMSARSDLGSDFESAGQVIDEGAPRAGGDAQDAAGSSADATSGAPAANSAEGLQESTAESVGNDIDDVPTRAPVDVFAGLKLTITVRIR